MALNLPYLQFMKKNGGMSGAIRQKALKWPDLTKMEAHGKREDESSQRRRVRAAEPLVVGGLDLRDLRAEWMGGVKQQGNTAALHALVQYPTSLIDGTARDQQATMLKHAVHFMNEFHGGDAVFAARLDRDEKGRHTVDVFMMPRHDFRYKDGRIQKRAAVSKHTKAEAQRRYGKQDRRAQGSALQDAWFEYMRDEMRLDVLPPEKKKATAKDRLEPEELALRKDRRKLKNNAGKLLRADQLARKRNQEQAARNGAEAKRLAAQRSEVAPALAAAEEFAKRQGDAQGAERLKGLQERLKRTQGRSTAMRTLRATPMAKKASLVVDAAFKAIDGDER
jgi:hypothetical protein